MKLLPRLLAATLVAFAASTTILLAADDVTVAKIYAANPVNGETTTSKKMKVHTHSHMTESTGMSAPDSATGPSHCESMDKNMPMHDHMMEQH